MVFEKKGKNNWLLNGKYKADEVVVGYMIQVLTNAKMKSIPSRNALEYIHQAIKNRGIVVEVYGANDDVLKKFSIGSDVQNGDATYMVMDGFEQAYAMELPALGGSLRSRFEQPLDKYRDKYIYREPAASIKSVKVEYHNDCLLYTSYLTPTEGSAEIDGFDIINNPLEVKSRVGYLAEQNPLYDDMYVCLLYTSRCV